ncbi:MAG: hypothetical protein JOZ91_10225 [Candidatus Eremiobacteraeota bacterium]|nr:hypothetical protein [Candidatus Eremiobacteraeota bacterium]MBV8203407.1 hypothetical protein [Candidatus Eremiobacteraeota bacterium]MBV8262290.1 hypothetical protein [Candidatus Eremiobacteraeota bacterium]MBV8340189.1 hypothetical protein [Candidatus Eremiobacteraeota bacterium]MBV8461540.1 hypothetical protein [Candidatus Eremiobacteraeota bacterium]
MSGVAGVDHAELLLVPYTRAIELCAGREVTLSVVTPPYPALGRGTLHVVRATDDGGVMHLEAAYDDYERLQ